jgi:integrase
MPGLGSRRATEALARMVDELRLLRDTGVSPTGELLKWFESLKPEVRGRLVGMGLIDPRRAMAVRPLRGHLEEFRQDILARGRTARHAGETHAQVSDVVEGCGFVWWSEVSAHRVLAWLKCRRDAGMSARTSNHYLRAVKSFCAWMVRDGRAAESPVQFLTSLNVASDRRRERRALTLDETRSLLAASRTGPVRNHMTGPERALVYRLALETGLRLSELRSLKRDSFDLAGAPRTVVVEAAYSKRRRRDSLILRPDLVALLRPHLLRVRSGEPAFHLPRRAAEMLARDLAAAGIKQAKLGKDNRLSGPVVDFHALRHTFGTNLVEAGVHPKIAQALMRHSTIQLTMDIYSHVGREREAEALAKLPSLDAPAAGGAGESRAQEA